MTTDQPRMKHGLNPQSLDELLGLLTAYGPTKTLLQHAAQKYLRRFTRHRRARTQVRIVRTK
jgi:hypothetical protein